MDNDIVPHQRMKHTRRWANCTMTPDAHLRANNSPGANKRTAANLGTRPNNSAGSTVTASLKPGLGMHLRTRRNALFPENRQGAQG